jgi:membrane protein implicated in regulation of membrane protease activity
MGMFGFGDFGDIDLDTADFDLDGGDFDLDHGDIGGLSPLSLPLILSFGTVFGLFGTVFTSMNVDPIYVPLMAAAISTGVSAILFLVMLKVFVQTQTSTDVSFKTLVGREATITVPIRPPKVGQIMVITEERGRTLITATADDEIKTDSIVIIDRLVGSTAYVSEIQKGLVE